MDCAVNLLPRVFVNFHVVFFATVLLDLGHDLRFAVPADLPFTVFGANVRAAETNFLLAMFFAQGLALGGLVWRSCRVRGRALTGRQTRARFPWALRPKRRLFPRMGN